jgi:hypothetical protein
MFEGARGRNPFFVKKVAAHFCPNSAVAAATNRIALILEESSRMSVFLRSEFLGFFPQLV